MPLKTEMHQSDDNAGVHEFSVAWIDGVRVHEGMNVAELLGITHYEPPDTEATRGENERGPARYRRPKNLKGWFFWLLRKLFGYDPNGAIGGDHEAKGLDKPIYDVESYKHHRDAFIPGEEVILTEKIHGCNGRFVFEDDRMWAGSRKLWKKQAPGSIWWKALAQNPWIEEWCRANPGQTLYGEVVPCQAGYDYGCTGDEVKFFAFDIYTGNDGWSRPLNGQILTVPLLYRGPFSEEKFKELAEGPSTVYGAKHIREGAVARPVNERRVPGLGRLQLQIVSLKFLEKEVA